MNIKGKAKIISISDIKPYKNNAKIHTAEQIELIRKSIETNGYIQPICVDSKNVIVIGHGRYQAMMLMDSEQKIEVIDLSYLKPKEIKKLRILDNKIVSEDYDADLLQAEIESIYDSLDGDIEKVGDELAMSIKELSSMMEPEETQGDDDIPEDVKPVTKRGDLWELGEHRVLCGDSTSEDDVNRLMDGQKADMVFTDPPYGVSFVGIKGTMYKDGKKVGYDTAKEIKNDDLRDDDLRKLFLDSTIQIIKHTTGDAPIYIFFGINRSKEVLDGLADLNIVIRNWLIWDKGNVGFHCMGAQYKPNYESFLYCHKKKAKVNWCGSQQQQTIWRHGLERLGLHPTSKPVSLVCQGISNHSVGLILDLFLGSGSTLIASSKKNRKCYGMELDEHYCDVTRDRYIKWCTDNGKDPIIKLNGKIWKK